MAAAATTVYVGDGLIPCWAPDEAIQDAVQLIPGTYVAGTVIGQQSTFTATNDVQTLTVTGTPTGGTFTVQFNGVVSGPIQFNSTVVQTQAVLDAMAIYPGAGNIVVSGGTLPGATQVFTAALALAGRTQPNWTVYTNSLTGGASPAGAFAHTTPGTSVGGGWGAYNSGSADGTQTAKALLKFATTVDPFGNHICGGGEWGSKTKSANAYFKGYFKTAELTGIDTAGVGNLGRLARGATASLTNQATVLAMF